MGMGDKLLVEATMNKYWSIGATLGSKQLRTGEGKGENKHGKQLMKVRDILVSREQNCKSTTILQEKHAFKQETRERRSREARSGFLLHRTGPRNISSFFFFFLGTLFILTTC